MSWLSTERPVGRIGAQAAAFLVTRAVVLVTTIAVARDAGIEAYGLFAVAMLAYQAGLLLRDAGLGQGLIVSGHQPGLGWAAFASITAAGAGLAAVMALVGTLVTDALGATDLGHILRLLAVAFAVGSAGVASNALLERSLRFLARAWIDVAAYGLLGVVTAVGLRAGLGVQSLAWGYLAQAIVQTTIGLVLAPPWRDRGAELATFLRVARYGSVLWVVAGLGYLSANLDNAIVGWLGGSSALGAYALAYAVGNTITIGPAQVLNRVALPYYGAARNDAATIRRTMRSVVPLSMALGLVPAAVVTWLAPEIADLAFDNAVPVTLLILLGAYGFIRSVALGLGTAANGIGAARRTMEASLVNVAMMTIAIPVAYSFAGVSGVGVAVTAAIGLSTVYMIVALERRTGIHGRRYGLLASTAAGSWIVAALATAGLPLLVRVGLLAATWGVAGLLLAWAVGLSGRTASASWPRS